MKKNMIALLLSIVMTVGSIGGTPVLAAETTAEEAVAVEEETVEEATEISEEEDTAESVEATEEDPSQDSTESVEEAETTEEVEAVEDTEKADSADIADTSAEVAEVEEPTEDAEEVETEVERKDATLTEGDEVVGSGICGDNLTYTVTGLGNDLTLTISGEGDMYDYAYFHPTIPSAYTAGELPAWVSDAELRQRINRVIVEEGVTGIGSGAFSYVGSPKYGTKARIKKISLPSSLQRIGGYAFYYTGCDEITIGSANNPVTFEWKNPKTGQTMKGCGLARSNFRKVNICLSDDYGFDFENSFVESVVFLEGTETIPAQCFSGCEDLESVGIAGSVTSIVGQALSGCHNLAGVDIPTDGSMESIGYSAFENCYNLQTITLPNNLKSIGKSAFANCTSLVKINIPDSVTSIENDVFLGCTSLQTAKLSKSIDSIPYGLFSGCESLASISIPDSVTSIASKAFLNCKSLTTIEIPANVNTIVIGYSIMSNLQSSFAGTENLVEITVDPKNTAFKSYEGCLYNTDLTELLYCPEGKDKLIIAPSTTIIPRPALLCGEWGENDSNVKELYFGTCSPDISENAFSALKATAYYNNYLSNWPVDKRMNYGGEITWEEKALNLSECSMTISPTTYTYDGTAKKPAVTLKYGDKNLTNNTDYTISYSNNINAGTGTVTATGKGYFTGTVSKTFTIKRSYTISYNANGGTGTPSSQIKEENVSLTLSNTTPTKKCLISYNASGGSVSPASKDLNSTFKNWNTQKNGSGSFYNPGGTYNINADATLYAQWIDPIAGELAVPVRSGYAFAGWFTSASGGTQITEKSTITGNITIYAHWTDPYNMGDETYSFDNYRDSDSPYGHCFGMSITSAGYYNGLLDIRRIGGNTNTPLYSFSRTQIVKEPICYYQKRQGSYSNGAIVAGGSVYLKGRSDIASDWQAVVNYVKNHKYDNCGILQIGFRKEGGGHAINFLRYEKINGQDRIYAYDNNFPNQETYFYQDSYDRVLQTPVQTFSGAIDCIALRDSRIYFSLVEDFDSTHVLYMPKDAATVQGYSYTYLEGGLSDEEYVMYEIPENQECVTIIPYKDYADFIYMDTEFSFGEITDETRGELRFSSMDEHSGGLNASFIIYEDAYTTPTVTLSETSYAYNGKEQKPTVTVKVGAILLKESKDYIVEYPSGMINAGTYKINVTLKGDYSGTIFESFTIKKAANKITASNRTLSYSTKARTLSINAKASAGKITYKSNNSKVKVTSAGKVTIPAKFTGTAKITITAAGNSNYNKGTKTITITVPAKTTLSSVKNSASKKMRVVWKKNTSVTGYQIQYSLKSNFASPKTVTISKNTQYAKTISGLTKGKKYYVRIRTYKAVSGKKYYSAWSAAKAVTIKK